MSEDMNPRPATQAETPQYQQPDVPSQPRYGAPAARGQPQYQQPVAPGQPGIPAPAENDGLAIASLILGILWVWGLGSILAVIFGHVSMATAKRMYRRASGLAIAGLVLGYVGIVGGIISLALLIGAANT